MHKKLRYYYTRHPLGEPKPSGARGAGQILSRHFFNMALLTFAIEKKMKYDQCKHTYVVSEIYTCRLCTNIRMLSKFGTPKPLPL